MRETREEFEARYPRPETAAPDLYKRVLVRCTCEYYDEPGGAHWAWGYWYFDDPEHNLFSEETLAEPVPERGFR